MLARMTDTGYARLRLEVRVDEVDGVRTPQVVPLVDGRILGLGVEAHAVRGDYGRGTDPDVLLGRRSPLRPPDVGLELFDERPRAPLWRGSRAEDPVAISVRVERENAGWGAPHDAVVWADWQVQRWEGLTPPEAARFDPGQCFEELIRADVDRWWEDVPRRVARRVVSVLDDRPGVLGQWGFGLLGGRGWMIGDDGEVEISVVGPGGRHYLRFGRDPLGDPDAEAGRILDRLGDTHPERLPATVRSTVV